jgi:osmotically-inducible protein OsmY
MDMRNYNQQIEDAYVASRRQGNMMRDRNIERTSSQDRRNRYWSDRYQYPEQHQPYQQNYQADVERTDRYGYERSAMYSNQRINQDRRSEYPETYRSAQAGYRSEHVGKDLGRSDYNYQGTGRSLYSQEGQFAGRGPKNYRRSDERIKDDIIRNLTDDDFVDATDIDVQISNGEVTLTGTIDSRSAKRRVEELTESIRGVSNVENRLRVKATDDKSEIDVRREATA